MIYGLNFNNTPIPPAIAKRFRKEIWQPGHKRETRQRLVGVCDDAVELSFVLDIAQNGHRKLSHVEKKIGGKRWYAVYAS